MQQRTTPPDRSGAKPIFLDPLVRRMLIPRLVCRFNGGGALHLRRHNYLFRVARSAVKGEVDEVDRRAERLERSPQTLDGISSGRSNVDNVDKMGSVGGEGGPDMRFVR
jgi:hypothetical protein